MTPTLYGVSADLSAAFEGLRESPGISGPKYRQKDIDALAQMILCRNYGKATLELSYLMLAVSLKEPGETQHAWLNFFWLDEAISPKRFRCAFESMPKSAEPYLRIDEAGLTVKVSNDQFTLSATRIAVLASLLEFLVFIDPSVLQQDTLFTASPNEAAVKSLASQFQGLIYGFLADHLQTAQQQRRFRHLWSWLYEYCVTENETFDVSGGASSERKIYRAINDATVLAFWEQAVQDKDDSLGFRRYRTVAENFFDLRAAIKTVAAQQEVKHAISIGYDGDSDGEQRYGKGEVSPSQLSQTLEVVQTGTLEVDSLTQAPKFLTKQQAELCRPLVLAGELAFEMPLTVMRMRCFGDWQASLVQALRNRNQQHLVALLSETPTGHLCEYVEYMGLMKKLQKALLQSRNSGLYVLLHYRVPEVIGLLLQQLPSAQLASAQAIFEDLLGGYVDGYGYDFDPGRDGANDADKGRFITEVAAQLLEHWSELLLRVPELNILVQQLEKSFKANNRQGFKHLSDDLDCAPYLDGVNLLDRIQLHCAKHHQSLTELLKGKEESRNNDIDYEEMAAKFHSDLAIFRNRFISLYGAGI